VVIDDEEIVERLFSRSRRESIAADWSQYDFLLPRIEVRRSEIRKS
jgi:hypothetical protein